MNPACITTCPLDLQVHTIGSDLNACQYKTVIYSKLDLPNKLDFSVIPGITKMCVLFFMSYDHTMTTTSKSHDVLINTSAYTYTINFHVIKFPGGF